MPRRDMVIDCPKRISDNFRRRARKAFPAECYAFLLGTRDGNHVVIHEARYPKLEGTAPPGETGHIPAGAVMEAQAYATTKGWVLVGDIHSHTWTKEETKQHSIDRVLSEGDHDFWPGLDMVFGVINVEEWPGKKLTTSKPRFWGRLDAITTRFT